MRESTKTLMRKHGRRIDRALHNYLYFRWYYPYVKAASLAVGALKFVSWIAPLKHVGRAVFNRYHSKVLSGEDARRILTLNEDVRVVSDANRRIVPYPYAHSIIFQDPEFVAVMDCPCKKSYRAPADTINSCIVVGSGTGRFWLDTCAKYNARRISQEEALAIVRRFRGMGYVTQAFFKVATGGSTGVICNCHPDSCVSLKATAEARRLDPSLSMNAESGYAVRRDTSTCVACGACASACHFGAMAMTNGAPEYAVGRCMGCGLCVERCRHGAITLHRDPGKTMPLDLDLVKDWMGR
ncbi:MAG TPA: 4Fe-4S binding protein [Spirochaetota bacterium]|nr:4Fe-4S binding protein [Spirochaetota bacterium]HNT12424.1 4Fe-4S binding protein [Spirochaetota bacterium]